MNELQATPQSIVPTPLDASARPAVARVLYFALTASAVGAACYLAYGFGHLWAEWRQATQGVAAAALDAANENSLVAAMPLAGMWSFDELDWNFSSQFVEAKEVAARFEAMAAAPPGTTVAELPDTDQELLDLVETLQVRPVERAGNQVYLIDRRDFKAELIARAVAGRTKTVAVAVAYPQNGDRWQLFEFTPRPAAEKSAATELHLLPLPADARRSGGRYDDDGRLKMEFVSLDMTGDELVAKWKTCGWEARPSGLGNPNDFSYLCGRGDEVIYAWSQNSQGPLRNLMLVRSESPENTKP